MKKKVRLAAMHIALLQEEFTKEELSKAVELLRKNGRESVPLTLLLGDNQSKNSKSQARKPKTTAHRNQQSRAVVRLKKNEPEKYRLLADFDNSVRKGEIPLTLEDIRDLGEQYQKQFPAVKSRKEAIGKLMTILADLPISEIQTMLETVQKHKPSDDSEYQRLADFIITGGNYHNANR